MDPEYLKTLLLMHVRHGHLSLAQAADEMSRGLDLSIEGSPIGEALEELRVQEEHSRLHDDQGAIYDATARASR